MNTGDRAVVAERAGMWDDIKRLFALVGPQRAAVSAGVALLLIETASSLALPWLGGQFASSVIGGGVAAHDVAGVLAALLAVLMLQIGARGLAQTVVGGAAERIGARLRQRVYRHLQQLPLAFIAQRRQGEVLSVLTTDTYVLATYAGITLLGVIPMLLTAVGGAIAMVRIDVGLGLLATLTLPLFYLALRISGRRTRPLAVTLRDADARAMSTAAENIGMMALIKAYVREGVEAERFAGQVDEVSRLFRRQLMANAWIASLLQAAAAVAIIGVLWLASRRVMDGAMAADSLVAFLLYGQLLMRPVAGLAGVYGQTQNARASLRRVRECLDELPEGPTDTSSLVAPASHVRGDIQFEEVTFAYAGRLPALKRFNLSIRAGEIVALVGPNGAGKSTIAHLLLGLALPSSGRILLDGKDIATVPLAWLRTTIGIVHQHPMLFNATIAENIGQGRANATSGEIEAAARSALAHAFIEALPQGYATVVGDRGVRLSGGQQQRIALARVLLKNPPILILDEATAMFDADGERDIFATWKTAFVGRTVILITHGSAGLAIAHRVCTLPSSTGDHMDVRT